MTYELITSPVDARALVRSTLGHLRPELVDSAVLLTSEVTTYALLHSLDHVGLAVDVQHGAVRVEVQDGDALNVLEDAEFGRGEPDELRRVILERVATTWGVESRERGKAAIWFTLAL